MQDPTVNQQPGPFGVHHTHHMVVQIEHGVQTQRAHGQAHVHPKRVVQTVRGLADHSVIDLQSLDGGGCRTAVAGADLAFTLTGPHSGQHQRVLVPNNRVQTESGQLGVDAGKILVQAEAQDGEVRLYAINAEILRVHERKRERHEVQAVDEVAQPQRIDGHGEQQGADNQPVRQPGRCLHVRAGGRCDRAAHGHVPLVTGQPRAARQHDGQPRHDARAGHRAEEQTLDERGQRVVAVTVQRAHDVRRHANVVHAGRQQQREHRQAPPVAARTAAGGRHAENFPQENRQPRRLCGRTSLHDSVDVRSRFAYFMELIISN